MLLSYSDAFQATIVPRDNPSKLKVQRELDLTRASTGSGLGESGYRSQTGAENRIDLGDVGAVEQVEEFGYKVEAFGPAEREVLENAKIHSGLCRRVQRISNEGER